MLQTNIFFSSPSIYFGAYESVQEEEEEEDREWLFGDSLRISNEANAPIFLEQRIGLFLHYET